MLLQGQREKTPPPPSQYPGAIVRRGFTGGSRPQFPLVNVRRRSPMRGCFPCKHEKRCFISAFIHWIAPAVSVGAYRCAKRSYEIWIGVPPTCVCVVNVLSLFCVCIDWHNSILFRNIYIQVNNTLTWHEMHRDGKVRRPYRRGCCTV